MESFQSQVAVYLIHENRVANQYTNDIAGTLCKGNIQSKRIKPASFNILLLHSLCKSGVVII